MSLFWTNELNLSLEEILETLVKIKGMSTVKEKLEPQPASAPSLWKEVAQQLFARVTQLEERLDRIERDFAGGTDREDGGLTEYGRNLGMEEKKP